MKYVTRYLHTTAARSFPKEITGVFYDWDGTLVKLRLEGFLRCINDVRTEHNLAEMPSLGKSLRESLIPDNKCHIEQEQMLEKFTELFSKYPPTLIPGAEDLIKRMKEYGLIQGVVSNLPEKILRAEVEKLGLSHYFPVTLGSRHDEHLKPKPDLLEEAFGAVGIAPSKSILYLGDTAGDVDAANKAGCTSILVGKPELEAEPDIRVNDLDEIMHIIKTMSTKSNQTMRLA